MMRILPIAIVVYAVSACTSQITTMETTSISGPPTCEAGDVLNIRPASPESVQIQGLPDNAVLKQGYAVSSSSSCAFSVQGFVPQGFPYVILSNGLGARIDLNSREDSLSVIEPLGKPTMREISLHCEPLELHRWKRTATVARCNEGGNIQTGITFGKPLDAPVASIGAFQSTGQNSAVLLYGSQDFSGLKSLSLRD
ncbi:hypothetical protein [Erythrobacter sp.]|uniref:hypothetical protein n=1 Tax=Erythrobacter sp. TaxID=1042 RepID=UPI00311EC73E